MILTLSLVMCLSMAFPASAAAYPIYSNAKGYENFYNAVMSDSYSSTYPYVAFFIKDGGTNTNNLVYHAYRSKVANPIVRDEIIFYIGKYSLNGAFSEPVQVFYYKIPVVNVNAASYEYITFDLYRYTTGTNYANTRPSYFIPELSTFNMGVTTSSLFRSVEFPIDTTVLTALIAQAKAMKNTGYTQSSWNTLQTQLTAAENLLVTSGYTQEQVTNMANTLQSALDGLKLLPDTNELEALLADADAIGDVGYTSESWTRFVNARSSARSLASSADYTQSELDYILSELRTAMNGLTLNAVTPPDTSEPPKPQPSPLGYDLVSGDISGYLMPAPRLFYNYVLPVIPIALGLYGIYFSIRLIPRLGRIILRTLRR